jgi:hypothetical protein
VRGKEPAYSFDKLQFARSSRALTVISSRYLSFNSFFVRSATMWNSISLEIKSAHSTGEFQKFCFAHTPTLLSIGNIPLFLSLAYFVHSNFFLPNLVIIGCFVVSIVFSDILTNSFGKQNFVFKALIWRKWPILGGPARSQHLPYSQNFHSVELLKLSNYLFVSVAHA